MARTHAQRAGRAIGNPEPALRVEDLTPLASVDLQRDGALEGVLLEDAELAGIEAASVRLSEVGLRRVDLSGTRLRGVRLLDVLAAAVNAANGSWQYAQMGRVTFESSTLVGLDLGNGQLDQITFAECKLDLVNLRMSSLKDVAFLSCSLRGTDFYAAKLTSVRFVDCELHETDFSGASLERVDLRTSKLVDIRGTGALHGAIVDTGQLIDLAPSLAGEIGIRVEDELASTDPPAGRPTPNARG
jgi:uncharacterized protein YjbI with pentapeptide repeats